MKAYFMWKEVRPDGREFRMQSTLLEPQNFVVGVEIPETAEYFVNFAEIANARLTNQALPDPIHTPAAVKFCLSEFEKYFRSDQVSPEDFKPVDEGDEWEDEPKKENKPATDEDKWEDADTDDKTSDDDKWDEDTENWESE